MSEQLKVTSIKQLKEYAKGAIVRLPDFADGQPFVARLKRPSMLQLVKSGKIPNELLVRANELFMTDSAGFDSDDDKLMTQMFEILDTMASATFAEPTYDEMKEAGIELTDEQLMFVFNYTQRGVKALEQFRTE